MKKYIVLFIVCVLFFSLTACGNSESEGYFPEAEEMQSNLENAGYDVTIAYNSDYKHLSASKDYQYIEFYWVGKFSLWQNPWADENMVIFDIWDELENEYNNCDIFYTLENSIKYGNIVVCGTNSAVSAAGIQMPDHSSK